MKSERRRRRVGVAEAGVEELVESWWTVGGSRR